MTQQPESRSIADQLVAMEKTSPGLAEAYRREVSALTERKLSMPHRWLVGVVAIGWIGVLIGLWRERQEKLLESSLLAQFTLLAWVGGIVISVFMLWAAARGRVNRRITSGIFLVLAVAMVGGQGLLLLNAAFSMGDPVIRRQLTFSGIALLVIVGVSIAGSIIQAMYQRIEERLLRIELRLAVAAEPVVKSNDVMNDRKT